MAKTPILGPYGPTARTSRPPKIIDSDHNDDTWFGDCDVPPLIGPV